MSNFDQDDLFINDSMKSLINLSSEKESEICDNSTNV